MANPQPEPFVKFSKELFDALLLSRMPATHKEIVLAVIRRTYGDRGKKAAAISQTLLQRMTGRARSGVRRSMSELIKEGVIMQVAPASFGATAVLQLNKDYESWGKWSVPRASVIAEGHEVGEGHHGGLAQGHHGGLAQGHHGGLAQGHHGGTIEDFKTFEDFLTGGAEPPPSEEEDAPTAQTVVAFAIDRARESGADLTAKVKGHLAREVGKQFKAGADPQLIRAAVGELIERNKDPSNLCYVMRDLKGGGRVGAHSGRSQNGEW